MLRDNFTEIAELQAGRPTAKHDLLQTDLAATKATVTALTNELQDINLKQECLREKSTTADHSHNQVWTTGYGSHYLMGRVPQEWSK